jgi:hypothetical protein
VHACSAAYFSHALDLMRYYHTHMLCDCSGADTLVLPTLLAAVLC